MILAFITNLTRDGLEILGAGRQMAAQLDTDLAVLITVPGARDLAAEAGKYGAGKAYITEQPVEHAEGHLAALEAVCRREKPSVILFTTDTLGRELAPRLAARLGTAALVDCLGFTADMTFIKPVFGGKAMARVKLGTPAVVALRRRSFEPATETGGAAETIPVPSDGIPPSPLRLLERVKEKQEGIRLEDARVVISGGQGLGGAENFALLEELASLLGGAVGASRAAVDAGWVSSSRQIGQTGKIVAPDLYLAVGISGASQHLAGVSGAKNIVAINIDPEAPIFSAARLGIVDDYRKILPPLIEKVRELVGR